VAVVSAPLSRQARRLHSIEFASGTLPLQEDKITIRDAESNDAPELAVLMRELGYDTKQAEMESRLKLILSNPAHKTFVAIMDGRVCGMIGTLTYTSYEHTTDPVGSLRL
jgi:hypothetical protein